MTASTQLAKRVRIRTEITASGLLVATSPDLKGLLVAKNSREELRKAIPQYIADLYAACGVRVLVTPLEDGAEDDQPWVAVPVEVARRAIEESDAAA
jgi:hypothetical protein